MSGAPVESFVAEVLELEGALVERTTPGRLEAVLEPEHAAALGLGELVTLDAGGDAGGAVACGRGTELLTRLARAAIGERGRVAAVVVDEPAPSPRPPKAYTGLNLSLREGEVVATSAWTLLGVGRYLATSDDQRAGLVRVALPARGGGPVALPSLGALRLRPAVAEELPADELRRGFARLRATLVDEAVAQLAGFREAVARRHRRDAERVDGYFADVAEDLERRIAARREAPALRAKLDGLPAERERRRSQLAKNHALRLRVELVGLVALRGPGLRATLEVKRRKNALSLEVWFDALANQWAPLECAGCRASVYTFALCDAATHVLCAACWDRCGSGGHRDCVLCAGARPVPAWRRRLDAARAAPAPATGAGAPAPAPAEPAVAAAPQRPKAAPPPRAKATAPRPAPSPTPHAPGSSHGSLGKRATARDRVVDALRRLRIPLSNPDLQVLAGLSADEVRAVLVDLIAADEVEKSGQRRGTKYRWTGD